MAASYSELNPQSVLRDALLDPLPEITAMGLAYQEIFKVPALLEGGVARGRSIDCSGDPGILHGKLLVRNARDILSAAEGKTGIDIGSDRDASEQYAPESKSFTMKAYSGLAEKPMFEMTHGFTMSSEEEKMLVQRAASSCHIKLEKSTAGFFTNVDNEATGGIAAAGWDKINWQDGNVGGSALSNSDNFMDVMHALIAAQRLRGASPVNACYMGRGVAEKLCRESSILGRIVVSSGSGDENALSAFQGQRVVPVSFLQAVFRDHFGIEELVIGSLPENKDVAGTRGNHYVWSSDRLWIGTAGSLDMAVRGGQARVLSGAGAFCNLIGKVEVAVGPNEITAPTKMKAVAEVFSAPVCVDASKGAVITNLG